ncbi:hypothetical protein D910_02032 [Dendroctonus ponderosae]|uniref:lysozyme n=1 Tax=Dendroctonus ponderosae TaxID=77166 RepID=U4TSV7_DENPD|nr:hypothetical protein D910_02032 [Dendroctonus ponderosae]
MVLVRVWIWVSIWLVAAGKIYRRCDLVKELRNFDVPEEEIGTWVCIARHESNYDTGAMNPGSGDHGLLQISQLYWCSPPGDGYGCNSPCEKFRDDDIGDDLQCARRIFREHKRISGNGFNAWVVYPLYCAQNTTQYVQDCPEEPSGPAKPANGTNNEISVEEEGDGYHFPALPSLAKDPPQQSRAEKQLPFSKVSIHYSVPVNKEAFPQLPFNKHSIHHFIPLMSGSEQGSPTSEPSESTTFMEENEDSWIFNSQTLPPILPPARPPRPQGGPGGGRPGQGPGPGPNRPDGLLTTRRPLPMRPPRRRPGGIKPSSASADRARKFVKPAGAVEVGLDDNFVFLRTMRPCPGVFSPFAVRRLKVSGQGGRLEP